MVSSPPSQGNLCATGVYTEWLMITVNQDLKLNSKTHPYRIPPLLWFQAVCQLKPDTRSS
jgi:hypothetical protein